MSNSKLSTWQQQRAAQLSNVEVEETQEVVSKATLEKEVKAEKTKTTSKIKASVSFVEDSTPEE